MLSLLTIHRASLVALTVKNLPGMQETWVWTLDRHNPLGLHALAFLPGEPRGQRSLVGYSPRGCKESDTTEQLPHTHTLVNRTKVFLIDFSPFFLLPRSLVNCPLICPQTTALVCQDQQCLYYRLETWICYCTLCSLLSANSRVLTVTEGLLGPFLSCQRYVPFWFFFFKNTTFKKVVFFVVWYAEF